MASMLRMPSRRLSGRRCFEEFLAKVGGPGFASTRAFCRAVICACVRRAVGRHVPQPWWGDSGCLAVR